MVLALLVEFDGFLGLLVSLDVAPYGDNEQIGARNCKNEPTRQEEGTQNSNERTGGYRRIGAPATMARAGSRCGTLCLPITVTFGWHDAPR